jgi:hypothetical protein
MGRPGARDDLRRAGRHHFATSVAALRAKVDDVVRDLDHVEVVLDKQHCMAGINEAIQRSQQPLDIGQVQTRGRLVEDVDGVLGTLQRAELAGDLDALRLAPRQRRRGLSERLVAETELLQHLDPAAARRLLGKERHSFLD